MARNLSNAAASLLPYSTIEAAASGNVDAINAVLKHYERYIAALATRTLYDENGVPHLCLDEEKVCRMRTKLISSSLCTVNGLLFHYINQAPLFLSSLAGQSRHQSTFLRLSMLLHYTFSVLQQSHYQ